MILLFDNLYKNREKNKSQQLLNNSKTIFID